MRDQKLVQYIQSIKDIKYKFINTGKIVIDPRVRFQCQVSGCGEYGKNLMCPPNLPSLEDFQKVVDKYSKAVVIVYETYLKKDSDLKEQSDKSALKLHKIIYKVEKKAFEMGFPFAAGLIGGSCKLCKTCPDNIKDCRHKNMARPSMEAMGINVLETAKNAGFSLDFEEDKVKWTGMVLLD